MNMRMVAQVVGLGLEHAEHADLPTEEARIGGELLEGGGRGVKEEGVQP